MSRTGLPDGTLLLHIGPHKTGTTTIQNALWDNRSDLADQGVLYPGVHAHSMGPTMAAVLGRLDPGKDLAWHRARWYEMLDEIRDARPRVGVLSSEFYSDASDERIEWLLDELGPQVHVVVTLRPLVRIVGSQWQQYVQNRLAASYDDWLANVLDGPAHQQRTPSFWKRHRHDELVRRWVEKAGPERVTVVIVDDRDPQSLARSFEDLLSLRAGTLERSEERLNRSLTFDEAEFVRRFNTLRRDELWDNTDYDRFVRFGGARALQACPRAPADQQVLTPEWAVQRALAIGATSAHNIGATGARVLGSLETLSDPELAPMAGTNEAVVGVEPEAAAAFVAGILNNMARLPAPPDPRVGAGVAELQVWSRHRLVQHRMGADGEGALRAEIARLERRLRGHTPVAGASRGAILRELARRVRERAARHDS